MAELLEIQVIRADGPVKVVALEGSIEGEGAVKLVETFRTLQEQGARHVVADLGKVGFINSSGVGSLLILDKEFEDAGGSVAYVNLTSEVRNILRILDLDDELRICPSIEDACSTIGT